MHGVRIRVYANNTVLSGAYLYISNQKVTNACPWGNNDWYVIYLNHHAGNNRLYIQRKIAGGAVATLYNAAWLSSANNLVIEIEDGNINFYEGTTLRHTEAYCITGRDCFVYLVGRCGVVGWNGTDWFDIFWVRKFVSPEPIGGAWGSEEILPPVSPTNPNSSGYNEATGEIGFSWIDNATDEDGYIVEVSIDGGVTWTEIADLPADSTSYNDGNIICGTYYLYRVKAYNAGGDSNYATLTTPIYGYNCLGLGVGEWRYDYRWSHTAPKKIRANVVKRIEETKQIRARVSNSFEETIKTICRKLANNFEETNPIKGVPFIKFTETCSIIGNTIKKFEETNPILATIFTWFIEGKRIYGETKSIEEDIMERIEDIEGED